MIDDEEIEHRPRERTRQRCVTVPLPATVVRVLADVARGLEMAPPDLARELLTRWALRQGGPRAPEVDR